MRMLLAIAIAVSACSHDPEPPPCPAPPPCPVPATPPAPRAVPIPLVAPVWELVNDATFAPAGIATHYCCTAAGGARHRLVEIDRPGLWTITVHHQPTECTKGMVVFIGRVDDPYPQISEAHFANQHATVAVDVAVLEPLVLSIYIEGGNTCCGNVVLDRVEIVRRGDP